jgi:hypothetical protein
MFGLIAFNAPTFCGASVGGAVEAQWRRGRTNMFAFSWVLLVRDGSAGALVRGSEVVLTLARSGLSLCGADGWSGLEVDYKSISLRHPAYGGVLRRYDHAWNGVESLFPPLALAFPMVVEDNRD